MQEKLENKLIHILKVLIKTNEFPCFLWSLSKFHFFFLFSCSDYCDKFTVWCYRFWIWSKHYFWQFSSKSSGRHNYSQWLYFNVSLATCKMVSIYSQFIHLAPYFCKFLLDIFPGSQLKSFCYLHYCFKPYSFNQRRIHKSRYFNTTRLLKLFFPQLLTSMLHCTV